MSDDRILSVHDLCVIAALVEHTEVKGEHRRIVHTSRHSALVGRDHHEMVLVKLNIRHTLDERLYHLICRLNVVEADKRNGILYSDVVNVEGNDVRDTHVLKLLHRNGAVEGLSDVTLVLTALVEHRHDNGYPACLSGDCIYDSLEVGKVVVGAHGILCPVHLVSHAVIVHICDDIHIVTAHRLVKNGFPLAVSESLAFGSDNIGRAAAAAPPFVQIAVNLLDKLLASRHSDYRKLAVISVFHQK